MLNVIMPSVVMLNVVALLKGTNILARIYSNIAEIKLSNVFVRFKKSKMVKVAVKLSVAIY